MFPIAPLFSYRPPIAPFLLTAPLNLANAPWGAVAPTLGTTVLEESAAKKIAQVPLSARTVAKRIEDMAEDIETQLLEQIVKSPWFAIQCDESTDIENKAVLLVFVRYLHEEDIHEDILCVLLLPKNTTASELFKSLNEYF